MNVEDMVIPDFDVLRAERYRKEVSAKEIYRVCSNFDEDDAEAALKALLKKYPSLYYKVMAKDYIKKLSTLEAMNSFLELRNAE